LSSPEKGSPRRGRGLLTLTMGNNNFFDYRSNLTNLARKNRKYLSKAESLVWNVILKGKKFDYKFLKQKPIGNYIVDFYCTKLKLVIEIDDSSHEYKYNKDIDRENYFKKIGLKIIRYTNNQVEKYLEYIFEDIKNQIKIREKELNI